MTNIRDIPLFGESSSEEIEAASKLGVPMGKAELLETLEDVLAGLHRVHHALLHVMPSAAPEVIRNTVPTLERLLRDCRALPKDGRGTAK